jgi:predicted acylesterase/phospholipase RssA
MTISSEKEHNPDLEQNSEQISLSLDKGPNIEHLVLSGGGIAMFAIYGAIKESAKSGFWKKQNIKSIWGTSAGAIVSGFILLSDDWDLLDNYLIKRPWDKVFNVNLYTLMNAYSTCGLFTSTITEEVFGPFLRSLDYPINITLALSAANTAGITVSNLTNSILLQNAITAVNLPILQTPPPTPSGNVVTGTANLFTTGSMALAIYNALTAATTATPSGAGLTGGNRDKLTAYAITQAIINLYNNYQN